MKLWKRYLYREFLSVFALFIFGFYFLYVVIDYSAHMQEFTTGKHISLYKVVFYYLLHFVKRMDILLPMALLIGSIKVLCQLNQSKELLAFLAAGISIRKLIRPLFSLALLVAGVNLVSNEFLTPFSLNYIDQFQDTYMRHSFRGKRVDPLHVIHLKDASKLIYQSYDAAKQSYFDAIWLENAQSLWRMRYLKADPENPEGLWVDHIQKKQDGSFEKTDSYPTFYFDQMQWDVHTPRKGFIPFENRSLSEIWSLLKKEAHLPETKRAEALTQLLFKLTMPFLGFLALLGVLPYCLRPNRHMPQFLIYSISLFSFIAFIALMDAAVILGESNTFPPWLVILSPFITFFAIFGSTTRWAR